MSEDSPKSGAPQPAEHRKRSTRKLSFPSRVRDALRGGANVVLGADKAWSVAFVLVTVALLASQRCGVAYGRFQVGDSAPRDIRAHTDIEVVDHALTEQGRQEARDALLEVYVHDVGRERRLTSDLSTLFREGREVLESLSKEPEARLKETARRRLQGRAAPSALEALIEDGFSVELERRLVTSLQPVMRRLIIGNKAILEREPAIVLVHVPGEHQETFSDYSAVLDLGEAREQIKRELRFPREMGADQREALSELVASYVDVNVAYDADRSFADREAAAAAVPPAVVKVPRRTLLVREGERITPEILARLEAARQASPNRLGIPEILGLLTLATLLSFFLYRYTSFHQRRFKKVQNLHALLVLVLLTMLLLAQGLLWLARGVADNLVFPFNQVDTYSYLMPLGAGAILVALLANGRIAMVYSAFAALLFGALVGWDFYRMGWALLVQWAGVYAISTYRERAALLRAGLVVGGAGAATALAVEVLQGTLEPLSRSIYAASLAFLGGAVGIGLLISFALPLFEGLFNVLTDIRLLELSNVNNPIPSQLAVRAPGSYNHSLVVATLAEEAAKSIGANSLLCRVAAFYHDIGKMRKPEYYVENMQGENPHDRLSPSMSALIIASHVKDGIQMAREAGLPPQIVDIIPQHHGTRLMRYFYEKAKKAEDPSLGPVKEEDFRYPGPKPQTKEAAIFMLADGVEAAARTVDEPTANRLKEVIRKISNSIVLERQLEECDLTFADLHRIQDAFLRTLVSFHHQRVEYPGFEFRRPRGGGKSGTAREQTSRSSGSRKPAGKAP